MFYNINIVIADDHEIFLDGLSLMLSRQEGFNVLGRASNGKQLIELVKQGKTGCGADGHQDADNRWDRKHQTAIGRSPGFKSNCFIDV
jgi:hypothetical protein